MIKKTIQYFLYFLILLTIGVLYLSYFGLETKRFNQVIKDKISETNSKIDIELNIEMTDADMLAFTLAKAGDLTQEFTIFQNDLVEIKSFLKKSIAIRVTRFDLTTGKDSVIGIIPMTDVLNNPDDQQDAQNYGKLVTSIEDFKNFPDDLSTIIYKIEPHVLPVDELVSFIKTSMRNINAISQSQRMFNSIATQAVLSKDREKNIVSVVGKKYSSRSVLKKGVIRAPREMIESVSGDMYFKGRTGDMHYVESLGRNPNVDFQVETITQFNPINPYDKFNKIVSETYSIDGKTYEVDHLNNKRHFLITFQMSGDIHQVDYVIIYCIKNNAKLGAQI